MPHDGHEGHEHALETDGNLRADLVELISVGVDIGSSTSHLAFSRLQLERDVSRYVVTARTLLYESPIMFTPYIGREDIDSDSLRTFVNSCYRDAGLTQADVDTGALILTGVAVHRRNARAIGEVFASDAGKFVAVSAGDGLEATMAAQGSGATHRSKDMAGSVLNIDVGGGTTKLARCRAGRIEQVTALDGGARLIVADNQGRILRLESAGQAYAKECGFALALGAAVTPEHMTMIADRIAMRILEAAGLTPLSHDTRSLSRLPPFDGDERPELVIVSGGVSEFIYGQIDATFGDLGPALARCLLERLHASGVNIEAPRATIRATVIGASQYTIQVSGATIFIHPPGAVPVRNVPVVFAELDLFSEKIDSNAVQSAIHRARVALDLAQPSSALALAFQWRGSATFQRLQDFCTGIQEGIRDLVAAGHPVILVNDGDVGGLIGLHFIKELQLDGAVISIDGIRLKAFDFIDIGAPISSHSAVPVAIKSLVFPVPA